MINDGSDTLLNNLHVNMFGTKNINIKRTKLGFTYCADDEDDDCKGVLLNIR
jgi:hypothetical protein